MITYLNFLMLTFFSIGIVGSVCASELEPSSSRTIPNISFANMVNADAPYEYTELYQAFDVKLYGHLSGVFFYGKLTLTSCDYPDYQFTFNTQTGSFSLKSNIHDAAENRLIDIRNNNNRFHSVTSMPAITFYGNEGVSYSYCELNQAYYNISLYCSKSKNPLRGNLILDYYDKGSYCFGFETGNKTSILRYSANQGFLIDVNYNKYSFVPAGHPSEEIITEGA